MDVKRMRKHIYKTVVSETYQPSVNTSIPSSNAFSFRPNQNAFGRKLFAVSTIVKCISARSFPDYNAFIGKFLQCRQRRRSSYARTMSYNIRTREITKFFFGILFHYVVIFEHHSDILIFSQDTTSFSPMENYPMGGKLNF